MPRTATSVINDVIRQIGKPRSLFLSWEIPVERPGWECRVQVNVYSYSFDDGRLHIQVHASGFRTAEVPRGIASQNILIGNALPLRLTRKWIETVLRKEIETAVLTALSFTEDELRDVFSLEGSRSFEDWQREREYFESTLR